MITTPLVTRPPFAASPDTLSRINNNGYRSLPYNILLCLFSSVKLLFNVVVLLKDQNTLPGLQLWLTLSTISDVIGTILLIIETVVLLYYRPIGNRDPESDEENTMDYHEIRELNKSKVYITATILNNCYYFFLWVWGHHIYFKSCSGCYQSQQTIAFLVFIYLYFGYFYIGCSILMAILNYSCFSFFTFSQTRLASRAKKWSPLQGLTMKQYSADAVSTTECYICLVNYNEGDKLVELPCNSKHNFHETCIKKWLKINNACPLCRKPLGRLSDASTMNEIELPTMIV